MVRLTRSRRPSTVTTLAIGQGVVSAGDGAWLTVWAIFLTSHSGLSPGEFALGVAVGGSLGLLLGVPLGRLADRVGPKPVLIGLTLIGAVALAAFLAVQGFWTFLPVVLAAVACDKARVGVFQAYVLALTEEHDRMGGLADQQAARAIGFTLGGVVGGVVLALNSPPAFVTLVLANAATNLVFAAILLALPTTPAPRSHTRSVVRVVRDPPFLALVGVGTVLALCWGMLSTGAPLWIAHHTRLPVSAAGVLMVLNSALIAVLLRKATRSDNPPRVSARKALLAGSVLAVSCALFATTGSTHGPLAFGLLLVAGCVHALGEILFVAAYWELTVAFTPEDATGEYQAMAGVGTSAATVLAPLIVIPLVVTLGTPGWAVLAVAFLLAGALAIPFTAWAHTTRHLRV